MIHPLLQRLTDVKIQDFGDLVGETIINLSEFDVLYLVTSSGKWCMIRSDDAEEYTESVHISQGQVEGYEVKILAELGMVPAAEMEEWERYLAALDKEEKERQQLAQIARLRMLIDAYPDVAREILTESETRI